MDINELEAFKLEDAVKFHDKLNPNLWIGTHLDPKVRKQLMLIAEDFITTLGISDLDVKDITVSGSNAAYSYTDHSDLDLHILVDMEKLQNNEIYRELFTAKKTLYNDQHSITIRNVPVEVYVQDTNEPVQSLGEYSVLNDKWIKIPKKQRANFDQAATKAKYENLAKLVELAIKTADIDRVKKMIDMVKRYRKAGLSTGGEFSPENLAYKAVRSQGGIDALYDLRDKLHGEELSIEEASSREDAIIKINKLMNMSGRTENEMATSRAIISKLMKQFNIAPEEVSVSQSTLATNYPKREPVDPLKAKMAAAAYQKQQAAYLLKSEWEKFKSKFSKFAEGEELNEAYTSKQQVIDHFVRAAKYRGEDVNLATRKGAAAWERGWRGPKPKASKEIKPYDAERYKNVRLPYIDEAENDIAKASTVQFKTLPGPRKPRHSFRVVYDGKVIAYGEVEKDSVHDDERGASVQEIVVHHKYRRMGIASKIYSAIERKFGYELHPSDDVRPDGQEFWKARSNIDEAPIKLYTDPNYFGADVDDTNLKNLPVDDIPINQLVGYEPDSKMNREDAKVNVKKILSSLMKGEEVPPILVRKWKNGYQVLDGHHRFYAYKLLKKKTIPAQIVPDEDIETVNEASGYIPSKKEANDPRFKTALTVDVKPDAIKKNAKAFGFKTSRAGIPPQARPDGKIK